MEIVHTNEQVACYRLPVLFGNTNCYLLVDQATKQAAIIDPGADAALIADKLSELKLSPALIINTHGHWDHIGANSALQQQFSLPLVINAADAAMLQDGELSVATYFRGDGNGGEPTRLLAEGDTIELGKSQIKVLHTPGHTPGSSCFLVDQLLFTGDTLFQLSIGRSDLAGGDFEQLEQSLGRLKTLDNELLVLPGHGPQSQIGYEKDHNPYLRG